ncbi:unnamed protein product [Rotaria sordida]|uniref:Uncharacterized protein n=1 Tax=Rotaria sordida TaxID=392033 RepID=A0A814ZMH5_9BILA|nr:unnamed protein product [Rotaria sordida]CAF1527894.1 unnamed protein product [Rotaria sordida]
MGTNVLETFNESSHSSAPNTSLTTNVCESSFHLNAIDFDSMPLSPSFRALLDNLRPEQEQSTGRIAREDVELNEVTTNNETMAVQNSTINSKN